MKLLVATPAYGGQVTAQYLQSMVMTTSGLFNDGLSFHIYTLETESLINRARNRCAMYAIENGFDRLFFIDADMIWSYKDFKTILDSDKAIVGGTYPVKELPIMINYNPLEDNEFFGQPHSEQNFRDYANKYADPKGEVEVAHIPTGFMAIRCEVLDRLARTKKVKVYMQREPGEKEPKGFFEFFPTGVHNGQLESEDWGFCRIAREAGYSVHLNTNVITGHVGTYHYKARK